MRGEPGNNVRLSRYSTFIRPQCLPLKVSFPDFISAFVTCSSSISTTCYKFWSQKVWKRDYSIKKIVTYVSLELCRECVVFNMGRAYLHRVYHLYNSGVQFSAVNTYTSYLKSVHTRDKLPIYDKWPQVKSKKYINLTLIEKEDITRPEADQFTRATVHGNIDDIKKSKRAIDIGQIAQLPDGSHPKCILVEGAPGVGKSTFAWKLCRKWEKGKLLQQYQLIVLLSL